MRSPSRTIHVYTDSDTNISGLVDEHSQNLELKLQILISRRRDHDCALRGGNLTSPTVL